MNFKEGNEVWLNMKKNWLLESLSHKFLGPYVNPFKVLEKKFPHTYKLELPENLKVHPIFHVSFLKLVHCDALRPPPNLVDNKPKFEMEVVLKLRQLRGWEWEYLVKWKGFHPIVASW